jgi:hypothetical protein
MIVFEHAMSLMLPLSFMFSTYILHVQNYYTILKDLALFQRTQKCYEIEVIKNQQRMSNEQGTIENI